MRRISVLALVALVAVAAQRSAAYVEIPYTLGRTVSESTNVLLVEVTRVNLEKGLIFFKKVADVKGKDATVEFKHNIGKRGFHPRESQYIMTWAAIGKKALIFHNGGASETCIDNYWYQTYREGEWWGMSHAEPFMLRTFAGAPETLASAVAGMLKGETVVVTCMADGKKDDFHVRKGKLQRLKANLKLHDYNAKRDFVGWGGDDNGEQIEYKNTPLLAESAAGWRFSPVTPEVLKTNAWQQPAFDESSWKTGKAPIGYGEEEIAKRQGTTIAEKGVSFLFRRSFEVPAEVLSQKDTTIRVSVASDDSAHVYLNGKLIDKDDEDHEYMYWNRDVELKPGDLKPGKNVVAVFVKNLPKSSDLYLDLEVVAQQVIKRIPAKKAEAPKTTSFIPLPVSTAPQLLASRIQDFRDEHLSFPSYGYRVWTEATALTVLDMVRQKR